MQCEKMAYFTDKKDRKKGEEKKNIHKDRNTEINSASEKHLCRRASMIQKVFSPSKN